MRLNGVEPSQVFPPTRPQAERAPHGRAESDLQSQIQSGCVRLNPAVSGADWRTTGARTVVSNRRRPVAGHPANICSVTTREKAHAVLEHLPEDRVDAALAALEAVEGKDTSVEAILARHGEQRLSSEEFDRHFGSLPTDDEG
jgi:hypothetical protein